MIERHALERQVGHALSIRLERCMRQTEKTRGPRNGPRRVLRPSGQANKRRYRGIDRSLDLRDSRAETGPAAHAGQRFLRPAGIALKRIMAAPSADDRANEDTLLRAGSNQREGFT